MCRAIGLMTLAAGVLAFSGASEAAVLYREIFPHKAVLGEGETTSTGWTTVRDVTSGSGGATTSVFNDLGAPTTVLPVNSNHQNDGIANGFLKRSGSAADWNLITTTEFSITADNRANLDTVSWWMLQKGQHSSANRMRLSVRIGDNWFVTNSDFGNFSTDATDADFDTLAQERSFEWTDAAASWRDLAVNSSLTDNAGNERLVMAGSARTEDLPAGDIGAFGLLVIRQSGQVGYFDSFAITVPEPGALTLLGFSGLLLRRRGARH